MVNVLIAGGTGNLGKTISDVLKVNPDHKVIVLSRQAKPSETGVYTVAADYQSIDALVEILNEHKIETVFSTMQVRDAEAGLCEVNLIKAAEAAPTVKRFIPSEFGLDITDPAFQLPVQPIHDLSTAALRETNLEWTVVYNSLIADWLGLPHLKSHLSLYAIHLDVTNKHASIPGSGNDTLCVSYSYDIARFMERMLTMPKWERKTYMYSAKTTYNEIVAEAEKVRGKFTVSYDPYEKLEKGEMTELPLQVNLYKFFPKVLMQKRFSTFGIYCIKGWYDVSGENTLNKQFPDMKTTSVKEMLSAWEGKE